MLSHFERHGVALARPRPVFGHGAEAALRPGLVLLGSYHVSQQNTNTGRLTPRMFDTVLARAKEILGARAGKFPDGP